MCEILINLYSLLPVNYIFLFVQVEQGFLSDVQNMGMYVGEMLDGQPNGHGTIGTFK